MHLVATPVRQGFSERMAPGVFVVNLWANLARPQKIEPFPHCACCTHEAKPGSIFCNDCGAHHGLTP